VIVPEGRAAGANPQPPVSRTPGSGVSMKLGMAYATTTVHTGIQGRGAETMPGAVQMRQILIRLGSQVMIPGKTMQRTRPTTMSKTNGVDDL
jgi:hypothetical protein